MADTLRTAILDNFYSYREYVLLIFGVVGVFLLLTAIGFTVIEPGTPTYAVNSMNFVALSVLFVVFGAISLYCFRTDRSFR